MKNLFTLFLLTLTALCFAQVQETRPVSKSHVAKRATLDARGMSFLTNYDQHSVARSSGSCDTTDIIDYNSYAQMVAVNAGLTYMGALSVQAYVQEASSSQITINSADNFLYSYVMEAFDTLVFPNYTTYTQTNDVNQSYYTKTLRTSTITLDSVAIVMGISGDTVSADGLMTNDSLVFQIYKIVNGTVNPTAVQRISYIGYSGLAPFFTGAGYITTGVIPVGTTFAQGEGFAVRADYYNYDTSSHCDFAFGEADSCQDLTYMGQDLGFSFAYPSPFIDYAQYVPAGYPGSDLYPGSAFWGEIDSVGPTTVTQSPASNAFGYFQGTGFPTNCAYTETQDWQFLPLVTVNNTLGTAINGTNPLTLACTGNPTRLVTTNSGDLGGVTYAWSSNVYGSTNTSSTTIYNPGTYDITVTNSSGCQATAEVVTQYASGINVTDSIMFPSQGADGHICLNTPWQFTSNAPGGYSSLWHFQQGPDSVTATASPTHTYTSAGVYNVTLILDSAGCTFATSESVIVSDCTGIKDVTFESNVSVMPNPSNGNVNVIINGADKNVTLTVYNVIGQVVKTFATTESPSIFSQQLDLTNLSNGTYLMKIQSGAKTATKKLVITK